MWWSRAVVVNEGHKGGKGLRRSGGGGVERDESLWSWMTDRRGGVVLRSPGRFALEGSGLPTQEWDVPGRGSGIQSFL